MRVMLSSHMKGYATPRVMEMDNVPSHSPLTNDHMKL